MFYNKEQKAYFIIAMVTMVVLIIVTVIQPSHFGYKDTTDYAALEAQAKDSQEQYRKYLETLKPDPEASRQLFKQLVSDDDVREQIESTLAIDQKVPTPDVPTNTLNVTSQTGSAAVTDYFRSSFGMTINANNETQDQLARVFGTQVPASSITPLISRNQDLVRNLRGLSVPQEVLAYHKAHILAYEQYGHVLEAARTYASNPDAVVWSDVYRDYAIANNEITLANTAFSKLNSQYHLSADLQQFFAEQTAHSSFAESTQALLIPGIGEIVIADIPAAIWHALQDAFARAFARFAISVLDKIITNIESNFAIASQLYYSESLGQLYSEQYLKKYITNVTDQQIIKKLIPEFYCLPQNREELRQIFTGKARDFLGFDPTTLNPSDPDFYSKLAKTGNFFASADGQEIYYRGLASQTAGAASEAATKEVLSPGLKSPRDLVNDQIIRTTAAIFNTEAAAITGSISLGTNNATNVVGQLVAGVIENLLNKYVFQGAVLQEQAVCVGIPQTKPVIPAEPTAYNYEPPSENPDDYVPGQQPTSTISPSNGLR